MKSKPVVVYVAHDVGGQGGMELHLEEIITRLKKEYEVIVVAASLNLADREGVRFIRIPVPARPVPLKMVLFAALASIRLLFLKRDILHTTGAIVLNRTDYSTVHFCHHGYLEAVGNTRADLSQSFWKRINSKFAVRFALWMEKRVYQNKRTKHLLAVSNRVRREIMHSFEYEEKQVSVIPNGVNLDRFRPPSEADKASLRVRYGFEEHGTYLLFMGGDWARKGLSYVVKAFDELAAGHSDLHLLIVGKGDSVPYEGIVNSAFKARVHFVGKQSQPEDWMRMSDFFIFPSSYETFSLVVHEAAAAGLAILATEVGGIEDLIQHGTNGFFIERDKNNIRDTIELLLHDKNKTESIGMQAREQVQKLTWLNTYDLMNQEYERHLTARGEGRGSVLEHLNQ